MPLFEVAILENPTKKAAEDGIGHGALCGFAIGANLTRKR
jgi:hypothetical protein